MRKVKLGKISKVVSGSTAPKAEAFNEKEGLPFVRAGHLEALCNGEDINNLPKVKEGSGKLVAVPKHTVIFAKSGMSIMKNRIYTTTEKVYIVNHLAGVICNQQFIIPQYLKYFLLIFKPSTLIVDESYPSIRLKDIENIYIPLPDLQIQHKIVQVLDKAQSLIDKRKEQIKQCDELIQSLFYDMFGTMDIFKTKWEIKKLKDIANYHIGLTYKPSEICDDGIIVLRASNIQNGRIVLDDIVRVNKNIKSELLVKKGDILMCSRSGSASLVGKAALIPDLNEKMSFGAFMTIIRSDYNVYLLNYIRSSAFRSQIRSGATTTINQITLKMLDNIEVPFPPLELQNQFSEKVQKIEHQKQLLQQSLSLLEDNFNSLMQKAFKGELFQ